MKFKLSKILFFSLLVCLTLSCVCCKKNKNTSNESNDVVESVPIIESQTETTMQSQEESSIEESQSQELENSQSQSESQTVEESEVLEYESQLAFKTFTVDGLYARYEVTGETDTFDFTTEILQNGSTTYILAYDEHGQERLARKTVTLNNGDNVFYVLEMLNGEVLVVYTVTICKTNTYTVTFYLLDNTVYQTQLVESGNFLNQPQAPTSVAHDVTYWDYDFSSPITQKTDVYLAGQEKSEMAPFEFLSNETECKILGLKNTSIKEITLASYVTELASEAFKNATELTSVTINANLREISSYAFSGCTSLKTIEIPEGVTSIEGCAFYNCSKLERVDLPSSLTSLGISVFQECSSLKEIEIPSGVTELRGALFKQCWALERVKIPDTVIKIYAECFFDCKSLKSVQIPDSVTDIGMMTFTNCKKLTEVKLSENLTEISNYVFQQCESLSYIEIPNSVTKIGYSSFLNCTSLAKIKIGRQVSVIDTYAFDWCTNLAKVLYCGNKTGWQNINIIDYGNSYVKDRASIYYYTENPQDLPLDDDNYWCYDEDGNIKELAICIITVSNVYTQKAREGTSVTLQLPEDEEPPAQTMFVGWRIVETGLMFGANVDAITLIVTGNITILPVYKVL